MAKRISEGKQEKMERENASRDYISRQKKAEAMELLEKATLECEAFRDESGAEVLKRVKEVYLQGQEETLARVKAAIEKLENRHPATYKSNPFLSWERKGRRLALSDLREELGLK